MAERHDGAAPSESLLPSTFSARKVHLGLAAVHDTQSLSSISAEDRTTPFAFEDPIAFEIARSPKVDQNHSTMVARNNLTTSSLCGG